MYRIGKIYQLLYGHLYDSSTSPLYFLITNEKVTLLNICNQREGNYDKLFFYKK